MHQRTTISRPLRRLTRSLMTLVLALAVVVPLASPAGAQGRTIVSGDAVPSECNNGRGAGAIELTGDFEGCLTFFPKRFNCVEMNGFARYREAGREVFRGMYNGERGRFVTRYTLQATYTSGSCAEFEAGGFPFLNQLTGGCDHRIIGKRGAFAELQGLIQFFDIIPEPGVSGASNFFYAGHVRPAR